MLLAGGAVEGAGVGRAVPAGGASGEGVAGGGGMMGMDGLFGEHYGARGFDCPPDRAHLHEDDGAF